MLRIGLLLLCCAQMAAAGPWPREKGRGFAATSTEIGGITNARTFREVSHFSSLYMEYGLGRSLTLGLNIGYGSTADADTRAFLSMPILRTGGHNFAFELSLGTQAGREYSGVGLQYGRGFEFRDRSGWFTIETRMDHRIDNGIFADPPRQTKVDLTLGINHPGGSKTMAQLFLSRIGDVTYTTYSLGLVLPIGRNAHVEFDPLVKQWDEKSPPGLKIGLWYEF